MNNPRSESREGFGKEPIIPCITILRVFVSNIQPDERIWRDEIEMRADKTRTFLHRMHRSPIINSHIVGRLHSLLVSNCEF